MNCLFDIEVYRRGELKGKYEVLAEYPDELAAMNALAQLSRINSPLGCTAANTAWRKTLPKESLARLSERYSIDAVVIVTNVREYTREMPKDLRMNPNAMHIMMATAPKNPPPHGTLRTPEDTLVH